MTIITDIIKQIKRLREADTEHKKKVEWSEYRRMTNPDILEKLLRDVA